MAQPEDTCESRKTPVDLRCPSNMSATQRFVKTVNVKCLKGGNSKNFQHAFYRNFVLYPRTVFLFVCVAVYHLILHYKECNPVNPHRNRLRNTRVHTHARSVRADVDYSSGSQLVRRDLPHIVKIADLDPDGAIWFHLYTVRVKGRPWNLKVWEPLG